MIKDYSYLCSTRTRQASQRCSNAWGVFVFICSLSKYSNGKITALHEKIDEGGLSLPILRN